MNFRDPLFNTNSQDLTGPYREFDPAVVCAVNPTVFPVCSAPAAKLNRPESTLTGMMATDLSWPWGDATVPPPKLGHWLLQGLGLTSGDPLIAAQLFGHEGMADDPTTRPTGGLFELLASDTNLCHTNMLDCFSGRRALNPRCGRQATSVILAKEKWRPLCTQRTQRTQP